MAIYNRISARRGQQVALDITFMQAGQRADPYAIYRIEIFRGNTNAQNIVDAVDVADPDSTEYPSPVTRQPDPEAANLICPSPPDCEGTTESISDPSTGRYRYLWIVPSDAVVPDIYFDIWYYYSTQADSSSTDNLLEACNKFWVYSDEWYADGGLDTVRLSFEPLDIRFRKPEKRPIEIGIMPMPLYDYNYNLVAPLIPYLEPYISIWTNEGEQVVTNASCEMKLRQGSYRSNPWVISYMLDTCNFFKGAYKYRVMAILPDGSSRSSGDLYFKVL